MALRDQVWDRSSDSQYIVEPLYKGQVWGGSIVSYTVDPLYKGQVGGGEYRTVYE